jgi:hypothetical protein
MKGFHIAEEGHVVCLLLPHELNGNAHKTDIISLKDYSHIDFIIITGAGGTAATVTVEKNPALVAGSEVAIAFKYYAELTGSGDVLDRATDAGVGGFALAATANIMYVISVDAAELGEDYTGIDLNFTDPAAGLVACVVAVLSGARYAQESSVTALA